MPSAPGWYRYTHVWSDGSWAERCKVPEIDPSTPDIDVFTKTSAPLSMVTGVDASWVSAPPAQRVWRMPEPSTNDTV